MNGLLELAPGAPVSAILLLALSVLVLAIVMILRGRKGPRPEMRQLLAFGNLESEIRCAAERGQPIHIALGSGGLTGPDAIISLAGMQVIEGIVDTTVSYKNPPVITVGDPTLLPLAQDLLRRAYERQQLMDLYDPGCVHFIAPSPMAYAAGAAHTIIAEDANTNITAGAFGPEVSLITDAGARLNLPQLGAVAAPYAIGPLYPTTERLAVGEEVFASGAQLTGKRKYLAGLLAEDVLRLIIVLVILGAAALAFMS